MFIANALYKDQKYGLVTLAICTNESEVDVMKDSRGDGVFRVLYTKAIADAILRVAAVGTLPIDFSYFGEEYTLLKYTARPEERYHNKYRKNYVVRQVRIVRDTEIYVCSERCRCTKCFGDYGFDSLENLCGRVKTLDDPGRIVEIDVQHCTRCSRYFIDQESLAAYERRYGVLRFIKRHITGNEVESWRRSSVSYKEDTVLSRNGYSTSLFTDQRQAILAGLIKCGVSKAEIKDILSRFISQRSKRCPDAAVVWEADLEFVNSYALDEEERIEFL